MLAAAGWALPVAAVAAPVAYAGASMCTVVGSIQIGPTITVPIRAICTAQSQWMNPGTLQANFGEGRLPGSIQICNCGVAPTWYRWQETDTLSEFQIEVDGAHVDQNSAAAGWRAPFQLGFSGVGECKSFALTYRTSVDRPTTWTSVTIDFRLQSASSAAGPWSDVTGFGGATASTTGQIRRTFTGTVNFNSCSAGGSPNRVGVRSASPSSTSNTGD